MKDINRLVLDIETGTAEDADMFKPEFKEPRMTIKGEPDKRDKSIEQQELEWKDKLALSPLTGKILCCGYNSLEKEFCTNNDFEIVTLLSICEEIAISDILIGKDIKYFDLPFIIRRCWKRKITFPLSKIGYFNGSRFYYHDTVIDVAEIFKLGVYNEHYSLENISKFLGIGTKESNNSKHFEELWNTNREEAIEHCLNDIRLTKQLYERIFKNG